MYLIFFWYIIWQKPGYFCKIIIICCFLCISESTSRLIIRHLNLCIIHCFLELHIWTSHEIMTTLPIFRKWNYIIEHPHWTETFPKRQPRIFTRSADGKWKRCWWHVTQLTLFKASYFAATSFKTWSSVSEGTFAHILYLVACREGTLGQQETAERELIQSLSKHLKL